MSRSEWYTRPIVQTELTTIWRDGQVLRTDHLGRTRVLRSIEPIPEVPCAAEVTVDRLEDEVVL